MNGVDMEARDCEYLAPVVFVGGCREAEVGEGLEKGLSLTGNSGVWIGVGGDVPWAVANLEADRRNEGDAVKVVDIHAYLGFDKVGAFI
jgi:hypothetical protein